MTLNAYLALAFVGALLAAPIALVTAPIWLLWLHAQIRRRDCEGLHVLLPCSARTIARYAAAMIRGEAPADGWPIVARRVDRYLHTARSPRTWRLVAVFALMEVAPLARLQRTFSRMSLEQRRAFCDRHLSEARGLFRLLSLARQLIRLGYYSDATTHAWLEFAPMPRRAPLRRQHRAIGHPGKLNSAGA